MVCVCRVFCLTFPPFLFQPGFWEAPKRCQGTTKRWSARAWAVWVMWVHCSSVTGPRFFLLGGTVGSVAEVFCWFSHHSRSPVFGLSRQHKHLQTNKRRDKQHHKQQNSTMFLVKSDLGSIVLSIVLWCVHQHTGGPAPEPRVLAFFGSGGLNEELPLPKSDSNLTGGHGLSVISVDTSVPLHK